MPGIPQENTIEVGKREMIKARYVMKVLRSVEGETIDAKYPDYGQDQNIGLYDIVSPASMKKVERSGQTTVRGKNIRGNVDYGYCPLCLYASQNHWTLNNHVRMHFRVTMACGMPDCWYVSHNADSMWKHATQHGLQIAEPGPSLWKEEIIWVRTRIIKFPKAPVGSDNRRTTVNNPLGMSFWIPGEF